MRGVDQGMSQMTDQNSTRLSQPSAGGSHTRDLRFAGGVSAGLVSVILVGGALLAPIANWGGGQPSARDQGKTVTVHLPEASRPATPQTGSGGGSPSSSGPSLVPGPGGSLVVAPIELTSATPGSVLPGVSPGGGGGNGTGGTGAPGGGDGSGRTGATAGSGGDIDDAVSNALLVESNP